LPDRSDAGRSTPYDTSVHISSSKHGMQFRSFGSALLDDLDSARNTWIARDCKLEIWRFISVRDGKSQS
jgi:hypothetical protein